jgi:hypothetical protein
MKIIEKGFTFKKKKKKLEMCPGTSLAEIALFAKIVEIKLQSHPIAYLESHPEIVWDEFVKIRDLLIKEMHIRNKSLQ